MFLVALIVIAAVAYVLWTFLVMAYMIARGKW